jgi:hypothetical protein
MVRVDAVSDTAEVVEIQTFWYRSNELLVEDPVGWTLLAVEAGLAVSVRGARRLP